MIRAQACRSAHTSMVLPDDFRSSDTSGFSSSLVGLQSQPLERWRVERTCRLRFGLHER